MISSVIAKLNTQSVSLATTLAQIAAHPDLESGELVEDRLLPITIESNDGDNMEELTRWLQSRDCVEYVDVVFVHFEEADAPH